MTTFPQPQLCSVERVGHETHDTFTLELGAKSRTWFSSFQPGQFNMLYLFGAGEVPISLSGDPKEPHRMLHTIRAVGAVTRRLRDLKRGDYLGVRGPFGSFWPIDKVTQNDVLIIAGGIGLAPLRSAIYSLLAHRERYGKIILLYGARTPEDILYQGEFQKWQGKFGIEVIVTVDRATGKYKGRVGVVTMLIDKIALSPHKTVAMLCGPEVMMRFTIRELLDHGIAPSRIYLSMERNMKCAVGFCGHCLWGPQFICKDGPIFEYATIKAWFGRPET